MVSGVVTGSTRSCSRDLNNRYLFIAVSLVVLLSLCVYIYFLLFINIFFLKSLHHPPPTYRSPAGTYSKVESSACLYCNNGTYSSSAASPACTVCQPGRFASGVGAFTACTPCPKGSAAFSNTSTSCETCEAGRYSSSTGQSACLECSAGYVCLKGATRDRE